MVIAGQRTYVGDIGAIDDISHRVDIEIGIPMALLPTALAHARTFDSATDVLAIVEGYLGVSNRHPRKPTRRRS